MPRGKGSHVAATACVDGVDLLAVGHRVGGNKLRMYVGTCGTTLPAPNLRYLVAHRPGETMEWVEWGNIQIGADYKVMWLIL